MLKDYQEIERIVEELLYQFKRDNVEEDGTMYGRAKQPTEMLINRLQTSVTQALTSLTEAHKVTEDTSDGYHTFKEMYEFRLLYNAALFNEWAAQGKYDVHKSQRHFDGELCFGRNDYFVVVATLPTGQISNHYPMSDWDLFKCEAVEKAKAQWDGHTSQDVAKRLREFNIEVK
jgi:hypothetical protein